MRKRHYSGKRPKLDCSPTITLSVRSGVGAEVCSLPQKSVCRTRVLTSSKKLPAPLTSEAQWLTVEQSPSGLSRIPATHNPRKRLPMATASREYSLDHHLLERMKFSGMEQDNLADLISI